MCAKGTDEEVIQRWGQEWFQENYIQNGPPSVWNWQGEIYPCRIYLRHCVLAAAKCGAEVEASFLDDTYLYDKVTTIRQHLANDPSIMQEVPPESVAGRYDG